MEGAFTLRPYCKQRIHAIRGVLLALFFGGVAGFEWHGAFAWGLAAMILAEIILTLIDFVEEDRSRRLPPEERVLHGILGITGGAFVACLTPHLYAWSAMETALVTVTYGWRTWVLAAMSVGLICFAIRDGLSVKRLRIDQSS